jgi:hypothetical protein
MKRALLVAAPLLLALASAALADEYTASTASGLYVTPPSLATSTMTPAEAAQHATSLIAANTDGLTVTTSLPFPFPFYGTIYGQVSVADDGWLAFGSTTLVAAVNPTLPSTKAPNAVVAALWEDLRTPKKGSVVRFTTGTAPNRTFVVAWQHMDTAATATTADLSFEVLLHETTGVVEIAYAGTSTGTGLGFTAGIENETGTRAVGGPNLGNTNSEKPSQDQRFTPNPSAVTGTITRDRPTATETGLSATLQTNLPVVGARVEILREDTATRTVVGTALTGADGTFTATVLGLDGAPTLAVDLLAAGEESRVTDVDGKPYGRRVATGVVPAATVSIGAVHLDASVISAAPDFMKALNIQQAAQRGHAWVVAAAATHSPSTTVIPQLEIRWVTGAAAASGYTAATSTAAARATISDTSLNPDPYDDFVVLREYAQHVLASIAAFPSASAPHQWSNSVGSDQVAFLDGFSFWFAAAVQGSARFVDTTSATTSTVYDLEVLDPPVAVPAPPATPPSAALVPGAVAASLWDLADGANEPFDAFDGTLPGSGYDVLAALDQRKGADSLPTGASAWTISSFFTAWRADAPTAVADHRAASRIFIHYGTFPDDSFEPNDLPGEEKPSAGVGATMPNLILNPYNDDRFTFTLGTASLTVAVRYADATEVQVSVVDSNGVTNSSSSPSGGVVSPVSVTTDGLAQGPCTVIVEWKAGPAAHYTLGIAPTITLVTMSLPDWTEGEPYNQAIVVAGGLPPVTLSMKPSAPPGLTLVNPGGHLTGRPTAPGDYGLVIVADDQSGAGPRTIGALSLHVNPALNLPAVFALPSDDAVAADLGTGGTAASWTAVELPPAGLTLTGGATLHLEGPTSGSPRAFDVSGFATDSVGAAFATAPSHVVVCAPVTAARGADVAAASRIGFWFNAIAGSRASFDVSFTGGDAAPVLETIVDAAGTALDIGDVVRRQAGHTKVTNLAVPRSGRYFLVFLATDASSVTAARANVRAPARFSGVENFASAGATVDARFEAVKGARAKLVLTRGQAPVAATPKSIELISPSGTSLPLPTPRRSHGGARLTVGGVVLPESGEYVLRVGSDPNGSSGPAVYEVDLTTPANAEISTP